MPRKILILTANPDELYRVRADREMQRIQNKLYGASQRHQFIVSYQCAKPNDLLHLIEGEEPEIIHFCGHGDEHGIFLENELGNKAHLLTTKVLKKIFKRISKELPDVKCVILNACYSDIHAEAISEYIPYAIGMEEDILDSAAIAFAGTFYQDLGNGRSIREAFEGGCIAAQIFSDKEEPKLFIRSNAGFLQQTQETIAGLFGYFTFQNNLRRYSLRGLFVIVVIVTATFVIVSQGGFRVDSTLEKSLPCGSGVSTFFLPPENIISNSLIEKGLNSSGEAVLLNYKDNYANVVEATERFKEAEQTGNVEDYMMAEEQFANAIQKQFNNPEPYIYRNNSFARRMVQQEERILFTVAAVIPATSSEEKGRAEEMLRGIAHAQSCFNYGNCPTVNNPQGYVLEIKLFDDANDRGIAQDVARDIVGNPDILSVIGHYSSSINNAALPIYSSNNLAIVSPSGTDSSLGTGEENNVFFRAVPSSATMGGEIASQISNRKNSIKNVVGFVDTNDSYSRSLWENISTKLPQNLQNNTQKYELSNHTQFDKLIEKINSREKYAVVLIPPSTKGSFNNDDEGFNVAENIAKQISRENIIFGGHGSYNPKVLNQDFNQMLMVVPWFAKSSDEASSYAEKAEKFWNAQVSWVTAGSYDATQALLNALSSLSSSPVSDTAIMREKVIESLDKVQLSKEYTSGSILEFDEERELSQPGLSIIRVVNGNACSPEQTGFAFQLFSKPD